MTVPETLTRLENSIRDSADARPLIVVGMSGGVDSSTAAALLLAQNCRVVGLTMQLWDQRRLARVNPALPVRTEGRCCSTNDVYDARRVAEHLDLPFYVVNFQDRFEQTVVRPFVSEYLSGRTPLPCALCNNHIKFDELLRMARQIGADTVATGHYARVAYDPERRRYLLRKAVDHSKDQSYFLFGLTQEQLSRTLFPLGELRKQQVREMARRLALPVAEKPESQEICFVPGGDYAQFLQAYRQEQGAPLDDLGGEITAPDGTPLGHHDGLYNFTIGQRKGLGVATGQPLYVIAMDTAARKLVVGGEQHLYSQTCLVRDVNWIAMESLEQGRSASALRQAQGRERSRTVPAGPLSCRDGGPTGLRAAVKIRHQHTAAPATLTAENNLVRVRFDSPQRAVTPGQAAVFYQDDLVLGGGWIARVET